MLEKSNALNYNHPTKTNLTFDFNVGIKTHGHLYRYTGF